MRYAYTFAAACVALMWAAGPAIAQPVPLQKTESHVDERGCIDFEATACIDAQIDDLFDALTRPELLSAHLLRGRLLRVFVDAPVTGESLFSNKWYIQSPDEKILEWDGSTGAAWGPDGPPISWIEYRFIRSTHTIEEHPLGSTIPWVKDSVPRPDTKYVLSPINVGSATSVRVSSSLCWPPESPRTSTEKLRWAEEEERERLGGWLAIAQGEAGRIGKERLSVAMPTPPGPVPGQASATSTPTPILGPSH
jgi:hypothetical protein